MANKLKSQVSFRAFHIDGLEEDEIRKKEYSFQSITFDTGGNVLTETTHTPDGELEHQSTYRYNESGLAIEEILMEADEVISEHRTAEFDDQGRKWKERLHYIDGSYDETVYSYDESGNLTGMKTCDSEGEAGNTVVFSYSGSVLTSQREFDAQGELLSEKRFDYDESGNLVTESVSGTEEDVEMVYDYDEQGHRIMSRKYNSEGHLLERISYSRDEQGRATEAKEEGASGTEIVKMEYDEKGNMLRQITVNEDGMLISSVERTFDETDKLLTSRVSLESRGQRPAQDYRIRFEYEYYPE